MGLFAKHMNSTSHMSSNMSTAARSRGARSEGASSKGNHSKGSHKTYPTTTTRKSKKSSVISTISDATPLINNNINRHNPNFAVTDQYRKKSKAHNLSNSNIDLLTSKITSYRSGGSSRGSSRVPKSIQTAIVANTQQEQDLQDLEQQSNTKTRSRSAEPSMRSRRTLGSLMNPSSHHRRRSHSIEPDPSSSRGRGRNQSTPSASGNGNSQSHSQRHSRTTTTRSRSADPSKRSSQEHSVRASRSCSPSIDKARCYEDQQKYQSPSSSAYFCKSQTGEAEHRDDVVSGRGSTHRLSEMIPYRLGTDMSYLSDGMNLDKNTRCLLAAYDAKTLDDFYLMTDSDFSAFVQRGKANKLGIAPLQVRKVQMLRRWVKEVVDDNMIDADENSSGRLRKRNKIRIIPNDWKDQYNNDLPHLKLQLRQQGDSLFEKLKSYGLGGAFSCGAGGFIP